MELERRGAALAYVRTEAGREVDFLARYPDGRQDLIQVCADLDSPATRERETLALLEAAQEYPRVRLHIVALNADAVRGLPKSITLHAASAWLSET